MNIDDIDGISLDRWVAKAEGIEVKYSTALEAWRIIGEPDEIQWLPHQDWAQAGPIIEREKIAISPRAGEWTASIADPSENPNSPVVIAERTGATPLMAAMRCFVAHRFGEELPE